MRLFECVCSITASKKHQKACIRRPEFRERERGKEKVQESVHLEVKSDDAVKADMAWCISVSEPIYESKEKKIHTQQSRKQQSAIHHSTLHCFTAAFI